MAAVAGEIVIEMVADDRGFKVAVKDAGTVLRKLQGDFDTTTRAVKRMEAAQDSLSTKFRHMVMTLGNLRFVVMDINDIFLRLPMSILKTAGELEKMQQLMTGLSKETDLAKRKLEGMGDMQFVIGMAKNAPFDIQSLSDSFVKLKTAGINPANGSMQALVDSVARFGGTGDMLKRASIAIQQMSGKGVISMEELRQQLGEAVPTAMENMAEGMEMSMAQLAKLVSTGTLQAGPALSKMFLQMRLDNAGAAAEMMNTWVGMTAQLKTEWDLTAQYIAGNGFADASKKVVGELIALMRNEEFRQFAADFGQGMASAVAGIADVAKFIAKYRSEILMLAQAWLAYKVVFGTLIPGANALKKSYEDITAAAARHASNVRSLTKEKTDAVAKEIQAESARAKAASIASADIIVSRRGETAAAIAQNAAIKADYVRLNAALDSAQVRNRDVRLKGMTMSQKEASASLREMANTMDQNSARMRANAAEIVTHQAAIRSGRAEVARKAAAVAALGNTWSTTTVAARAASAAQAAGGLVMGALGGPIGVLVIAITGLVYWWNKTRDAANEAREAQLRAANGTTQKGDVEKIEDEGKKAAKAVEDARRRMNEATKASKNRPGARMLKTDEERAADAAAYNKAIAEDKRLNDLLMRSRRTLTEQAAEQTASNRAADLDRELRDMDLATRQKVAAINKDKAEYIKAHGKTSKEAVAEIAKFNRARVAVDQQGMDERKKIVDQRAQQARDMAKRAGISAEEKLALQLEAQKYDDIAKSLNVGMEAMVEATAGGGAGGAGGKAGKLPTESVAQKLAEKLAEDRARLEAEIAALRGTGAAAADEAGKVAELLTRRKNGDFKDKKTGQDIGDAQFNTLVADTAKLAQLEARKKKEEELIKEAEKLTAFAENLRPRYEEAMEGLANPLGDKAGSSERALDKLIVKMGGTLPEALKRAGLSLSELKDMAVLTDIAPQFEKLADETEKLNDALVKTDRKATVERMRLADELHRKKMQNLIDEAAMNGASPAELAKMQNELSKNVAARAATTAEKAKSPMAKMVDEWRKSTDAMENATAKWLDSSVEGLIRFVRTGEFEFGEFTASILEDLLRIQLQKQAVGLFDSVGGLEGMASAVAGFFGFANGGIMSPGGSVPLKKYAAGGIAKSPQLALYGEGSMNEAYVPLPDGRTIPVTMSGGGAPSVTVNVINQSGTQVGAQQGQPRFDGKQMILDVVLTAANTPGSFRDGMKGAMK